MRDEILPKDAFSGGTIFNETGATGRVALAGLSSGEHLIVCGLRRVVMECGPDSVLLDECYAAFAEDGDEAMRALCLFLCVLGRAARRMLEIGAPGAAYVTWDEGRILTLLAAAQKWAEEGDGLLADAHLQWLAAPEHRPALAQSALALSGLLAMHGHFLSLPAAVAPPEVGWSQDQSLARLRGRHC
jgi:hypothetical protein